MRVIAWGVPLVPVVVGIAGATIAQALLLPIPSRAQDTEREPLDVARVFASRYPERASMAYVPALSWVGSLRLADLTGDDRWREKPRRDLRPFLTGERNAIPEPYQVFTLAGHISSFELGRLGNEDAAALAREVARLLIPQEAGEVVRFATGWAEDMYMVSSLLARVGGTSGGEEYEGIVGRLLTAYVEILQRADGLFIHAPASPFAWGRGNGFAALGMSEALTWLPEDWAERSIVLEAYRRQMRALVTRQSDDGSWRQLVDDPASYRELTVTAMTVVAMARGVRLGWLDPEPYLPVIDQGWQAVLARTGEDGTVRDACTSTGAGPTREYYLERPTVNGADDRAGGLVLLAALEVEQMRRSPSSGGRD